MNRITGVSTRRRTDTSRRAPVRFDSDLYMLLCERSYVSLVELMADAKSLRELSGMPVRIDRLSSGRWVTEIRLRQLKRVHPGYPPLRILIRLYDDFLVAEIVEFEGSHPWLKRRTGQLDPLRTEATEKMVRAHFLDLWLKQLTPVRSR